MPGPRATKGKLRDVADSIERLTGIYPIPGNESPMGTESDRRYYWHDMFLREWFDANGAHPGVKVPHATKGTGPTLRALTEILDDALALLAVESSKSTLDATTTYVSDDYITRNIKSLTPASHHYLIQIRSDNPLGDIGSEWERSAKKTHTQTKWMNLTPEQLARIASVL